MKKLTLCTISLTLWATVFSQVPSITSFSPVSGPVGTTVVITGTNFNTVANQNLVSFGSVKAIVTNSTLNTLTVIVPAGIPYAPISVTANNLTAFSDKIFITTFPGGGSSFNQHSFKIENSGFNSGNGMAVGDINADSKMDFITGRSPGVNFHLNQTDNGQLLFSAANTLSLAPYYASNVAVSDIDGDGKPDIIAAINTNTANAISIFVNTSSGVTVSFAAKQDFVSTTSEDSWGIAVKDLDADGKPDIIVSIAQHSRVSIYKNTSTAGNVSFIPMAEILITGSTPTGLICTDLDGDLKPDIATSNVNGSTISVFRNTSSTGIITFATQLALSTGAGSGPVKLTSGDVDGDGKTDIISVNQHADNVSVFRNVSTTGNLSFEPKVNFAVGYEPVDLCIADFDGDGKPDLAVSNSDTLAVTGNKIALLKNNSAINNISFKPAFYFSPGPNPYQLISGDMDADGKSDIIVSINGTEAILQNRTGYPDTVSLCNGATIRFDSDVTGTSYQWQVDIGTGFTNIIDGINYSGSTSMSLLIQNAPSSFYNYKYRCVSNTGTGDPFTIVFENTWSGIAGNAWENPANWSCGTVPDANTDVIINSGTVIVSTSTTIRTLNLSADANLIITPGVNLTILH